MSWYGCAVTPLGFLPCASAAPPSATSPSEFCALDGCVSMSDSSLLVYSWGWAGGIFAAPLGFLPCAVLFLRACGVRYFSCCRFPWGFKVTGCQSFCFPGDVGWLQPFPSFSMLLLLRLLAGVAGVMHPVSGCSRSGGVCLV